MALTSKELEGDNRRWAHELIDLLTNDGDLLEAIEELEAIYDSAKRRKKSADRPRFEQRGEQVVDLNGARIALPKFVRTNFICIEGMEDVES